VQPGRLGELGLGQQVAHTVVDDQLLRSSLEHLERLAEASQQLPLQPRAEPLQPQPQIVAVAPGQLAVEPAGQLRQLGLVGVLADPHHLLANQVALHEQHDEHVPRLERLGAGLERELLGSLGQALEMFERGSETLVVHDGVRNLLAQPEFTEAARLHEVLEVLEETRHLTALLQQLVGDSDMQIVIGSENATSQLRSCAVILTTYGPSNRLKGVLGVVGPTRMKYGQVLGRLQVAAQAASDRMSELH